LRSSSIANDAVISRDLGQARGSSLPNQPKTCHYVLHACYRSTFFDGVALGEGGCIGAYNNRLIVRLRRSIFEGCTSALSGGSVSCWYISDISISGCEFINSWAQQDGGAIYLNRLQATTIIRGTIMSGSKANLHGGSIAIDGAIGVHVYESVFVGSTAGAAGGDIDVDALATLVLQVVKMSGSVSPQGSMINLGQDAKFEGVLLRCEVICGGSPTIFRATPSDVSDLLSSPALSAPCTCLQYRILS
jgi:hypothetical protein